jgi:hypothetical protein
LANKLTKIGENFWRVEGDFRIGGLVNVGTQASLVRLADGNFVFLDSYTLPDTVKAEVDILTEAGAKLVAIINLHPFHTLHCEWMHRAYPEAALYGTQRHHRKLPDLPWQEQRCESGVLEEAFGDDFAFSIPRGVPLVCDDESVHFSSILALHRASGTIHVDDTLVYLDKGFPLSLLPLTGRVDFHPTLGKALETSPGATDAFREWAITLGIEWAQAKRIAAAHDAVRELGPEEFPQVIGEALGRAKPVLDAHRAEHG